jgi:glycerol kinase
VLETTALGAAYLAGLATGVWKDTAAIGRQWGVGRRFEPVMNRAEAEARMHGWMRALHRSKDWAGR